MVRIVGVRAVICTCGKEMRRTGGIFGSGYTSSTYYCHKCNKAVNVIDLPRDEVNKIKEAQ